MKFRVFLSSTFAEFHELRNRLKSDALDQLRQYCEARDAVFEAVDLRWGVTSDVASAQRTVRVCLSEVDRCTSLGVRPCFILLIGSRSGTRPLPHTISQSDFETLLMGCDSVADRELIQRWYRIDKNNLPSQACLLERNAETEADWVASEALLFSAIDRSARKSALAQVSAQTATVTLQELRQAVSVLGDGAISLVAVRNDPVDANDEFMDVLLEEAEAASGRRVIRFDNTPDGVEALQREILTRLKSEIDEALDADQATTAFEREAQAHQRFADEICSSMVGRDALVSDILIHEKAHLLVTGAGGIGKSAVMAAAAKRASTTAQTTVLQRFIGATPASLNLSNLISGLADELVERAGDRARLDERLYDTEFDKLRSAIGTVSSGSRIRFFIDGLDQLELDPRSALWDGLGGQWPDNVQFVTSAAHGAVADQLAKRIPDVAVIETPGLGTEDQLAAIARRLEVFGRKLQPEQYSQLQGRLGEDATPLVLRLLTDALREVRSFDPIEETLKLSLDSVLAHLLQRLRLEGHGEALISASLGLLAVARQGLTETELRQLLFRDDATRAEFVALHPNSPSTDELPSIIWARLRNQLDYLLRETDGHSGRLLTFFHRVVREAIERLELTGFNLAERAGQLAEYFLEQSHFAALPNERKLMELPNALQRAGRSAELAELLSDETFILAKCRMNRSDDLIGDFDRLEDRRSPTLAAVEALLRRSAHLLRRGREAWRADRILVQVALESPPEDLSRSLFERACSEGEQFLWLRRTWPNDGSSPTVLEGHEDEVLGFLSADDERGITWSADGTIRVWGLRDGECHQVHSVQGRHAEDVWLLDSSTIFAWSRTAVAAWDIQSGRELLQTPALNDTSWVAAARWQDSAVLLANDACIYVASLDPPGPPVAISPAHQSEFLSPADPDGSGPAALSITEDGDAIFHLDGHVFCVGLHSPHNRWDIDRTIARLERLPHGCVMAGQDGGLLTWNARSGVQEIRSAVVDVAGRPRPWLLCMRDRAAVAVENRWSVGRESEIAVLVLDEHARPVGQGLALRSRDDQITMQSWTGPHRDVAEAAAVDLIKDQASVIGAKRQSPNRVFDGAVARGSQVYIGRTDQEHEDRPLEHLGQCQDLAGLRLLADGQAVAYRRAESNDPGLYFFDARSGVLTKRLQGQAVRIEHNGRIIFEDPTLIQMGGFGPRSISKINGMLLHDELVVTWGFGSAVHFWDPLRDTPIATLVVPNVVEIFAAVRLDGAPMNRPDQIVVMTSKGQLIAYEPVRNQARFLETGVSTFDYARRNEHWGLRNIAGGLAWFFRNFPINFWPSEQLFSDRDTKKPRLFFHAGYDPDQAQRALAASLRSSAQVCELVDLSDERFAAIQANEVIEVFPISGGDAEARLAGAGLSKLTNADYVSWSSSAGLRRWRATSASEGTDLNVAWQSPPPDRAVLEGAEVLERRGYLTWASDRRFRLHDLDTGEKVLEVPQLEAIFNHPEFIASKARANEGDRSSALEWTAWNSDRVLGLTSTDETGPTVLWHGDERVNLCDISEDGLLAALTESGRPVILQLYQGLEPVELPPPQGTGRLPKTSPRSQEPIFQRVHARQRFLSAMHATAEAEILKSVLRDNIEHLDPETRLTEQLKEISDEMRARKWRVASKRALALAESASDTQARLTFEACDRVAQWALGSVKQAIAGLPSDADQRRQFVGSLTLIRHSFRDPDVSRASQVLTEAATRSMTSDPTMLAVRLAAIEDILSWSRMTWGIRLNAWLSLRAVPSDAERANWRTRFALAKAINPASRDPDGKGLSRVIARMAEAWPVEGGEPLMLATAAKAVIQAAKGKSPPEDLRRYANMLIELAHRTHADLPLLDTLNQMGPMSLPTDTGQDRAETLVALHGAFGAVANSSPNDALKAAASLGAAEAALSLADWQIQHAVDAVSLEPIDSALELIAKNFDGASPLALDVSGRLKARRAVLGPVDDAIPTFSAAERAAWQSNKPGFIVNVALARSLALAQRGKRDQAEQLIGAMLVAVVESTRKLTPVSPREAKYVRQVFEDAVRSARDLRHPDAAPRWALQALGGAESSRSGKGDLISIALGELVTQPGVPVADETADVVRHALSGFGAFNGSAGAPTLVAFVERLIATRPEILEQCAPEIVEKLGRLAPRLVDEPSPPSWVYRIGPALRPHCGQIASPSEAQSAGLKLLMIE